MYKPSKKLIIIIVLLLSSTLIYSQKITTNKYPSLFWEITGNGLKKPSYLFGTMHVSNKMVFNLSDSFYIAMNSVAAVALELNPDLWQGKMVRLDETKQNYANYTKPFGDDLLTETSFRINKCEEELKAALSSEPMVVNSLLYRTYKAKEDFEEDTFLDLYIFQTGKKLGKRSAGVEDFNETEKIVMQAYADMATEKKKKAVDTDGESMRDITKKIQEAYRRGDLDLMDSLDIMTERSIAFREKFLYLRNEVQANSIDTILKTSSLFVGVGAAHLPGARGIIELLRKKGYKLRPITMTERDTKKKEATDKLKVPVQFAQRKADDGFYTVNMPGPLFKMTEDIQQLDRRQYSDMSNGSYYLVTRVKTHGAFLGQSTNQMLDKIDSMFYENIPGKILTKKVIENNGYKGYDITNRTRTGDLQRYNIFITPFETLIFKMSGKENYVDGEEARQFFSSIHLKEINNSLTEFTPPQGGFTVKFPQAPNQSVAENNNDGIDRWEYEATDKTTGDGYLVLKKSVYNFKFLEEDSFDLKLIEESFRSPDFFDKQLQRKLTSFDGYPCLDVKEKMKDGSFVTARYIIKGPQYYVIAAHSKNAKKDFTPYINSFHFDPYVYSSTKMFVDTFMHFTVTTAASPDLDEDYRSKLEQVSQEVTRSKLYASYNNYFPKNKNALFRNDSTGEMVGVTIQQYPQYFYVKDSAKFWTGELNEYLEKNDLQLYSKDSFLLKDGVRGFKFILRDSGSSRTIERMMLLKDNYLFNLVTMGDTLNHKNEHINKFYASFAPAQKITGRDIFKNCLDQFFLDLFSKDSLVNATAVKAISNVYYGEKGEPKIISALQKLSTANKDYYSIKSKLIAELGYIKDDTKPVVDSNLKLIYQQTADTSIFQNEVVEALARRKTEAAIKLFKQFVMQDPPVFDKDYEYSTLFNNLQDSLKLAANLYPELLQLTTLQDYKEPIISLLVKLVDSGFVKVKQYESFYSKIYFDAKIALKKQQAKDELKIQSDKNADISEDNNNTESIRTYTNIYSSNNNNVSLNNYTVLLMPFYDSNANIPKFFDKLLKSEDEDIRMKTATLLLRNNKLVADSILLLFALNDRTRARLFTKLEQIKRLDKFPTKYNTQLAMARSFLVADKNYPKIDTIIFISKQVASYSRKSGYVYFFKYRIKKEDDFKIGISGMQPLNIKLASSDDKISFMTEKKLRNDKPENEQFQEQLKKILYSQHKSAKSFFEEDGNGYHFRKISDYEE